MRTLVLGVVSLLVPTTGSSTPSRPLTIDGFVAGVSRGPAGRALSRTPPRPLTIDGFVTGVLRGPAGRALDREVDLAGARSRGAGVWPNPSVAWNREALPGSGVAQSTQDIVWLSVPLVVSGRTFAEDAAAKVGVQAARLVRISRRAQLERRARVVFYRALAARRRRVLFREAEGRFGAVAAVLKARAAAGEASAYEALRLDLERAELEDRAAGADLALGAVKADMRALAGGEAVGDVVGALVPDARAEAPAPVAAGPPLAVRARALAVEVEVARARARAAARRAVPDPVVGLGIQRQGGEGAGAFIGYFVGVTVPLPLFDHGQGPAAEAWVMAEQRAVERVRWLAAAAASLAEARRRLETNRARLAHQTSVAREVSILVETALKGYTLGGMSLLALIDAERSALDVRIRAADRAFDVREAEVDLAYLTGAYDQKGDAP